MAIMPFPLLNTTAFNISQGTDYTRGDNPLMHLLHVLHVPVYVVAITLIVIVYRRYRIQSRPLPPRPSSFERALNDETHPINTDPLYITPNEP